MKVSECIGDIASWMRSNTLQLNPGKAEVLWCSTGRRLHQLPTAGQSIDSVPVPLVPSVHDLGIFIDSDCWVLHYFTALLPVTSDPLFATNGHIAIVGGRPGPLSARIWQQCAGRHYCLFSMSSPVSAQCSCMAYLQFEMVRSHHRCPCQLSLAVHSGMNHKVRSPS